MNEIKKVYIPDEITMDYNKSEEELRREWKEYTEQAKKAFEELEKMNKEGCTEKFPK